jgi:hypothetical protein
METTFNNPFTICDPSTILIKAYPNTSFQADLISWDSIFTQDSLELMRLMSSYSSIPVDLYISCKINKDELFISWLGISINYQHNK